MHYTYILRSIKKPSKRYVGYTSNIDQRLKEHNEGKCVHTKKYIPWKVKLYVAFISDEKAKKFERYLKSGSGHAFAKRHF